MRDEIPSEKKPKKMRINQDYVKEKVKQQFRNLVTKNMNKRNNNKSKGAMKGMGRIGTMSTIFTK